MPAAYAHHRFGETCINSMPEKLRKLCLRYREVFDFGVHGPDVLFYYNPIKKNEVNSFGSELHHWTGKQFFGLCSSIYRGMSDNDSLEPEQKHAMLAYLLGFLAHFTLDSCCHGYINQMTEESEYSHNLIESQYEVFLMEMDGKKPMWVDRSKPLKPCRKNAAVLGAFFPFYEEEVLKSMKGQKMVLHIFYSPLQGKKYVIRKLMKVVGVKGDFADLFLDKEHIEECDGFNQEILFRQEKAEQIYPELLKNLVRYLYGKEELTDYFDHDFEGLIHSPE